MAVPILKERILLSEFKPMLGTKFHTQQYLDPKKDLKISKPGIDNTIDF